MLIIQSGGIWCANGKFGTTWRLHQCMVEDNEEEGCLIQVDEASLKQFRSSQPSEPKATHAEDSDDEEETPIMVVNDDAAAAEEPAVEEPVVEEPVGDAAEELDEEPKKKRTVRKKKA